MREKLEKIIDAYEELEQKLAILRFLPTSTNTISLQRVTPTRVRLL